MLARDFCYWLQGYFEIQSKYAPDAQTPLTAEQVECIKRHLNLVFIHDIDPSAGGPEEQAKLNAIHNGMTPEQVEEMKKRIEDLEKRPPQVVRYEGSSRPPMIRC